MNLFDEMSGRIVAAVSSLAISAFLFANAIIPASPNLVAGGVFA